jgi:hypothetical protein
MGPTTLTGAPDREAVLASDGRLALLHQALAAEQVSTTFEAVTLLHFTQANWTPIAATILSPLIRRQRDSTTHLDNFVNCIFRLLLYFFVTSNRYDMTVGVKSEFCTGKLFFETVKVWTELLNHLFHKVRRHGPTAEMDFKLLAFMQV